MTIVFSVVVAYIMLAMVALAILACVASNEASTQDILIGAALWPAILILWMVR